MKLRFVSHCVALVALIVSDAVLAETLTKEKLNQMVLKGNPSIQAAELEKEAAGTLKGSLLRSFLPELSLSAGTRFFQSGAEPEESQSAWEAEASLNLYNGGIDLLADQRRQFESQLAEYQLDQTQIDQLRSASEKFWNAVFLKEKKTLLENEIRKTKVALKAAEKRVARGVAIASDRIEFELHENSLKSQLRETTLALEQSLFELRNALGLPPGEPMEIAEKMAPVPSEKESLLFQRNNRAKIAELESEIYKSEAKAAKNFWLPSLDLFYLKENNIERIETVPEADNQETMIGLRLVFDLGQSGQRFAESKALRLKAQASQLRAAQESHTLAGELSFLKKQHQLLKTQILQTQQVLDKTRLYLRLTLSDYDRGVKNSPDVVGAMEKVFSTEVLYLELVRDHNALQINIE